VGQENLLLQTYKATLPPIHNRDTTLIPGTRDVTATIILNSLQPSLLLDHVPISVTGDGNCMFRALSKALYGTENLHTLLRLLTSLEIACFPATYDTSHSHYENVVADSRVTVPSYNDCLQTACKLGSATELIHMYAASAVIERPIQSVFPLRSSHYSAWDRLVTGRNVTHQTTSIHLLWSSASVPQDMRNFSANHFVLLHPVTNASQIQPIPSMPHTCPAPSRTDNAKRPRPYASRGRPKKKARRTAAVVTEAQHDTDKTASEETRAITDEQMDWTDDKRESTRRPDDFHSEADIDVSAIPAVNGSTGHQVRRSVTCVQGRLN